MSRRCTGIIVDHALECPHLQWLNRGNHAASGRESSPPSAWACSPRVAEGHCCGSQ